MAASAAKFIGLQVEATTKKGNTYLGIVSEIDVVQGRVVLSDALETTNGLRLPLGRVTLPRADVRQLKVISTTKTSPSPAAGASSGGGHPSSPVDLKATSINAFSSPSPQTKLSTTDFNPSIPNLNETPLPHYQQQPLDSDADDLEPESSSSGHLHQQQHDKAPRKQRERNRRGKKSKSSAAFAAAVESGHGDEADVSTAAGYEEDEGVRNRNGHQPYQQPVHPQNAFAGDFDFQSNLDSFDKAAVFADIRRQDQTDPHTRLVAHNRSSGNQVKLLPKENVLTVEELEEQQFDRQRLLPQPGSRASPAVDAGGTDFRRGDSYDAPPHVPVHATFVERRPTLKASSSGSSSVLRASIGNAAPAGGTRSLSTQSGIKVVPVKLKQFKEALSIADIETGPNPVQRAENAGRGIAAFILRNLTISRKLFPYSQRQRPFICVLAGDCDKGTVALRAGAHLCNHGAKVVTFILKAKADDYEEGFRTNLREFSSAGGRILRDLEDLQQQEFDLLIDAIADNDTQSALEHRTPGDLSAASWASTSQIPILSIDAPLGTDHDTGVATSAQPIQPDYLVCRGALRPGAATSGAEIVLVDMGISPSLWSRVGVDDWDWGTFGAEFVVELA
ncbi:YjeF N-terminal domain-like protein [Meredithblackwellia eburnea MCA 4105]